MFLKNNFSKRNFDFLKNKKFVKNVLIFLEQKIFNYKKKKLSKFRKSFFYLIYKS